MALSADIEVLCIPGNGSSMFITNIPLIPIGHGGINRDECNDLEKQLQHIPNVESLDSLKIFRWTYRKLVGYTKNDEGHEPWNDDYMMYLCLDERSELPHNDYLEGLVNLGKELEDQGREPIKPVPLKVYGDAFVFRMKSKSKGSDERMPAQYIHMTSGFVDSATSVRLDNGVIDIVTSRSHVGVWALVVLRRLLMCPHKRA